ncbi:MAG TPA: plastocyanin/azurin family copper-binding protein [Solirubrobacteraceae bacterium]
MGTPPANQKTFQEKYFADVNAFFPTNTRIHVGDTVRFLPVGFHNVHLPKKGGKALDFLVPAGTSTGEKDAAGNPFWFEGRPTLGFNPVLGPPGQFGKSLSYNGSKAINTGAPLADKPKPVKVKFTKTGTFTYFCDIHTGMKAKVHVVSRRSSAPSAKAHKAAIARQVKKAESTAKLLANAKAPSAGVSIGTAGSGGVERYAFSPSKLNVKVGDTVTFTMASKSYDVHTATTGEGDPDKGTGYIGGLAKAFEGNVFPGAAIYASDNPAQGNATLTPQSHGNGFWNTGLLDAAGSTSLPKTGSVKFGAPGTYTFYCLIHPFMKGTVTATA